MIQSKGTYVDFPVTRDTHDRLVEYAKSMGLPEPQHVLHVTTVYSRTPIDYKPLITATDYPVSGHTQGMMFLKGNESLGLCLILPVVAPLIFRSHNEAKKLGATWDYPDFNPHITLAYNLDMDILIGKVFQTKSISLIFEAEVIKELDFDWSPA